MVAAEPVLRTYARAASACLAVLSSRAAVADTVAAITAGAELAKVPLAAALMVAGVDMAAPSTKTAQA
jgi:hypothetical protein